MNMTPRIDIVTQSDARSSVLIIGIQVGILGKVLRLGLYNESKRK